MLCVLNLSLSGITLGFITAVEIRQTFGMVPMAVCKEERIELYLMLLDKVIYLGTETSRINKHSDACLRVCYQEAVDSVTSYSKTPEYEVGHHGDVSLRYKVK
jgi:hypothetical protein